MVAGVPFPRMVTRISLTRVTFRNNVTGHALTRTAFGSIVGRKELTNALTQSGPSQPNCLGQGQGIQHTIIIGFNKVVQKLVHGTTIGPHDGQRWSMMNTKHFLKMPGVDHPSGPANFDLAFGFSDTVLAGSAHA